MSSHLITTLTKKSYFGKVIGVPDPYFLAFISVLVFTIFFVFYCFMTIYDKHFFKNLF